MLRRDFFKGTAAALTGCFITPFTDFLTGTTVDASALSALRPVSIPITPEKMFPKGLPEWEQYFGTYESLKTEDGKQAPTGTKIARALTWLTFDQSAFTHGVIGAYYDYSKAILADEPGIAKGSKEGARKYLEYFEGMEPIDLVKIAVGRATAIMEDRRINSVFATRANPLIIAMTDGTVAEFKRRKVWQDAQECDQNHQTYLTEQEKRWTEDPQLRRLLAVRRLVYCRSFQDSTDMTPRQRVALSEKKLEEMAKRHQEWIRKSRSR